MTNSGDDKTTDIDIGGDNDHNNLPAKFRARWRKRGGRRKRTLDTYYDQVGGLVTN